MRQGGRRRNTNGCQAPTSWEAGTGGLHAPSGGPTCQAQWYARQDRILHSPARMYHALCTMHLCLHAHLYMPLARSFSIIFCSEGKVNRAENMVRMDRNITSKNSSPAVISGGAPLREYECSQADGAGAE